MRIASITAGASGMFCGSCMRDNTLVSALCEMGHDALLIPTYTPITTDEVDVSQKRVFFGGVNVYLQDKFWLFRHTPWLFDRILDARGLLRWVSRFASRTSYSEMGSLAISMLQGTHGHQRKEVEKLALWLRDEVKPEIVLLTNVLLSGISPRLKELLGVPIIATLQGDDIFLDALTPKDRERCLARIRDNSKAIDGFLATSVSYADFMAEYLGIERGKIQVVYPGISLKGHSIHPRMTNPHPVIGYLARICPEKGFHHLIEAFVHLRSQSTIPYRLHASGWLGENHRPFFELQKTRLATAGLLEDFHYTETPDHATKVKFFSGIDVFSVPTTYREPKGLYLLEAWANGIPVVQPAHGTFPELIRETEGGILVPPNNPQALAEGLQQVLERVDLREQMGQRARRVVSERFNAATMARLTAELLQRYLPAKV